MVVWSTTSRALWHFLAMMGRKCSRLDPNYQRHITFACTGCYQLHPHHRLGIIIPRLITGTNLPTSKGWRAWWAKADCTHITFAQGYYTIKYKGIGRKWTQIVRPKTNSIPVNQLHRTERSEKLIAACAGRSGIEPWTPLHERPVAEPLPFDRLFWRECCIQFWHDIRCSPLPPTMRDWPPTDPD